MLVKTTQVTISLRSKLSSRTRFNQQEKDLSSSNKGSDSLKDQVRTLYLPCTVLGATPGTTMILIRREAIASLSHFRILTQTIAS